MQAIQNEVFNLLSYVLLALLTAAVSYGVKYLKSKGLLIKLENNKQIISDTVAYVEQVFKNLHGAEKFNTAKDRALKIMADKGIKISDEELSVLIEQSVKTMNDSIQKEVK